MNNESTSPLARDERETVSRWLVDLTVGACAKVLTKRQHTQVNNKDSAAKDRDEKPSKPKQFTTEKRLCYCLTSDNLHKVIGLRR